jgi:transcriptional regulator of arginine metabolism
MANKRERQATILDLVRSKEVSSQEELRRLLRQRGWDVTQATLSRDLRELRIGRVPTPSGARYAPANGGAEASRAALPGLMPQLFSNVDGVRELAVLRTVRGGAQPIAEALDSEQWPEVLGTIAGDDAILVVCRSSAAREKVMRRLRALAEGSSSSQH